MCLRGILLRLFHLFAKGSSMPVMTNERATAILNKAGEIELAAQGVLDANAAVVTKEAELAAAQTAASDAGTLTETKVGELQAL
jgi:hypothetical protein